MYTQNIDKNGCPVVKRKLPNAIKLMEDTVTATGHDVLVAFCFDSYYIFFDDISPAHTAPTHSPLLCFLRSGISMICCGPLLSAAPLISCFETIYSASAATHNKSCVAVSHANKKPYYRPIKIS